MSINENPSDIENDYDVVIKQLEILVGAYDNEANRSWVRFNIFIGLQLVAFVGIVANLEVLTINPLIFRFSLLFLGTVSLLFFLIVLRGISSQRILIKIIEDLNSNSNVEIKALSLLKKYSLLPKYVNQVISAIIALIFAFAWWVSLFYLEVTSYNINIPD